MHQEALPQAQEARAGIHSPPPDADTPEALQPVVLKTQDVSAHSDMDDAQREVQILHEGRAIEAAMARYAESSDLLDRADADAARLRMEGLIRGRSENQVHRLEQERGLR